jgi:hypothetical protein
LALALVALGVGLCQLRPGDEVHGAHAHAVAALAGALRAPATDPTRRQAAFSAAEDAAQASLRGASALVAFDPYPVFMLQAVEDLRGAPPIASTPIAAGVRALQQLDLAAARAAFTTASQSPDDAARAALYLRLLNELDVTFAPEHRGASSPTTPPAP